MTGIEVMRWAVADAQVPARMRSLIGSLRAWLRHA